MSDPNVDEKFIYKKYVYPSGEVLKLSREDFNCVVELFKIFYRQDQKQKLHPATSIQFEHSDFSLEKSL